MTRRRTLLTSTAAALAVAAPAAAHADYLGPIGAPGNGPGTLSQPWGIAAAADGSIYVTEIGRGRISVFDSAGGFQRAFGSLNGAAGIAVGVNGVYAVERNADRVARYTPAGVSLGTFGSKGVGNGQFQTPNAVAIQGSAVLVSSQYRFQRFNAAGTYVDGHGGAGSGLGDFEGLRDIATGADGSIFTTETTNHRVQRFSNVFAPQLQWGEKGTLDGQLTYPSGIAVDPETASVWVTDLADAKVQRFGLGGSFRDVVPVVPSGSPGHLSYPTGVAVDCRGTVYVVDSLDEHVQRFGVQEAPVEGNLLANGGFEAGGGSCDSSSAPAGAGPGWSTGAGTAVHYGASGGFPSRADGEYGGQSFLAGGPGNAKVVKEQTLDVSAQALDIDDGRRLAHLSGYLGGYGAQDDQATVEASYKDGAGKVLGVTTLKPVTAAERGNVTGLRSRDASLTVPKGTRNITVAVTLTRAPDGGGYNDAYADRLAFTLTPQRPPAGAPTTPTTPVPGGSAGDKTAPVLTLQVAAVRKAVKQGRLTLTVSCDEACAISASLKQGELSRGAGSLPVGTGKRALSVSLSAKLRKAIRKQGSATVALGVTATDAAGNAATTTRTLKLSR